MPLGVRDFLLVIRAKDQASRVIADVGRAFGNLDANVQAQAARTRQQGQALLGIGAGIGAVGAAGVAFFGSATKAAIDYNKEAAHTLTQVAQTGVELETIKDIGKDVAKAVPAPFKEMQPALYDIFSSMNVNVKEAERVLTAFSKAAVGGVTDVETASQAGITFLNAFKLPPTAENLQRVMDAQFETVRVGRIEYDEFAKTIGRAIPSAVKAGQSIEDLGGLMAFLTRNGLSAAMSATSAARAFDLMTNTKFTDKLKAVGVDTVFQEGPNKGKFRPFLDVMTDLRKRMSEVATPEDAKRMQDFMHSMIDPKALDYLENLGIQVKQTVGGKNFTGEIKKNQAAAAKITTENARLRVKATQATTKEEKKAIADAIANNNVQKAILSEQNVNLRAAGSKAKETLRPFADIIADINKKMEAMSPEERASFMQEMTKGAGGTIQAMRAVNLAITDQDELLKQLTLDVRDNAGAGEKAYKIMADTPSAQIQELSNKWKTLRTEIGDQMLPVLLRLVDIGIGVLEWFDNLSPGMQKAIIIGSAATAAFMLLAGATVGAAGAFLILQAALAPFALTIGGLMFLMVAWTTIIAAVGLAVYILITRWDDFKRGVRIILAEIVDYFLGWADNILSAAAAALGWMPGLGGKLKQARDEFRQWREDVYNDISGRPVEMAVKIKPQVEETASVRDFVKNSVQNQLLAPIPLKFHDTSYSTPLPSKDRMALQYRATGGPVRKWRDYIVGERGPELLRMGSQNGYVIPKYEVSSPPSRYDNGRQHGDTIINIPVKTDADANEIAHEVVFSLKYD